MQSPQRIAITATEQAMYRSVWERLLAAESILLVSPKRPDGDSVGSICGLRAALRTVGKNATLYCPDPIPPTFDILPYVYEIEQNYESRIKNHGFDAIVVVDAGDITFAGIAEELPMWKSGGGQLIVIDHHVTNTRYGDVNCIVTNAASTTEAIARMLIANHVFITEPIATALLFGLVTDTDGFTNPATSPSAVATAATLLSAGARMTPILRAVYQSKPVGALMLWGKALERLRVHPRWEIATTVLLPNDFTECAASMGQSAASVDGAGDGLSNFLQAVLPVRAILVLKDDGTGIVRGSLRTQRNDVDLSRLARQFGGGGHRKAAGFGVPGRIVSDGDRWRVE
ncbi:MAG: bifunctional oligoribonuclease/PAP phosphatase NrnA [bacterium]|nr:bifunctional oligoribonuclease/PAP phosphatase NrnA [bacterium]